MAFGQLGQILSILYGMNRLLPGELWYSSNKSIVMFRNDLSTSMCHLLSDLMVSSLMFYLVRKRVKPCLYNRLNLVVGCFFLRILTAPGVSVLTAVPPVEGSSC